MSIVTRTGDQGTTALMYGRRVPKDDPRVEACGTVDELNAALGLVRAVAESERLKGTVLGIQKDLITLMGELGVASEDRLRYLKDGFPPLTPEMTGRLDGWVRDLERQEVALKGWATPGGTAAGASLDFARAVCRRAERQTCGLKASGRLENPEIIVYLNRLSDLLWLLARHEDALGPGAP